MKILTDHFLFFGGYFQRYAPQSALKAPFGALFERLSSDPSTDARTPSIPSHHGHFPYFSPSNHSTARYDPGKTSRDPYAQKER